MVSPRCTTAGLSGAQAVLLDTAPYPLRWSREGRCWRDGERGVFFVGSMMTTGDERLEARLNSLPGSTGYSMWKRCSSGDPVRIESNARLPRPAETDRLSALEAGRRRNRPSQEGRSVLPVAAGRRRPGTLQAAASNAEKLRFLSRRAATGRSARRGSLRKRSSGEPDRRHQPREPSDRRVGKSTSKDRRRAAMTRARSCHGQRQRCAGRHVPCSGGRDLHAARGRPDCPVGSSASGDGTRGESPGLPVRLRCW